MKNSSTSLDSLIKTLKQIHNEKTGCPWLIKRFSHKSLSHYAIEEAYEVAEAIASEDPEALCEELGDLLLQVLLHSDIAEKKGDFTFEDICKNLENKIIRRYPHIFEEPRKILSEKEIEDQWKSIKEKEKILKKSK